MCGRTNQVIHKCLGKNSRSFYLRVDSRTKSLISTLVKKVKYYLRVEGRTKSLTSALVEILSLPTYGWMDEPSDPQVRWSKFYVFPPKGGRTNQTPQECHGKNSKSSYLWVNGRTKSPQVPWSKF